MAEAKSKSDFEMLNSINVSDKTEKKNGLTYLSWAYAWGELKKRFPNANYKVIKSDSGCIYHTDGRTCWVECSVTVNEQEHTEILPIMDFRNNSIPLEKVTSMDAIKAIQRCTTKCIARFGLGLYIYAGEDLPEEASETPTETVNNTKPSRKNAKASGASVAPCSVCGKTIGDYGQYTAKAIEQESTKKLGKPTCYACWTKLAQEAQKKNKEDSSNA